ncbi:MAG: aminoacyl-tRNA hydrolase [Chthoniobacterales bacterium]|nr:aminoacyl-tRNA hydrolase [Chthoniobacterales bacterium]
MRLVVGLGNPGAEYERTRHNIGFAVLEQLASEWKLNWERTQKWGAYWAKGDGALLLKPMTYMNRSGEPFAAVSEFYKIEPEQALVVLDDLSLELGRLRFRQGGSAGGHNGLDSILMHAGTDKVPRLRIGIGSAPHASATDWVLGRFFEEEMPLVQKGVTRAADAVKCAIDKGLLSAMNTFNKFPES